MGSSRRLLDQRDECILKQSQTQVASGADKITPFLILLIKTTVFSVCPKQAFFFFPAKYSGCTGCTPRGIRGSPLTSQHENPAQQAKNSLCLGSQQLCTLFGFHHAFISHTDTHTHRKAQCHRIYFCSVKREQGY